MERARILNAAKKIQSDKLTDQKEGSADLRAVLSSRRSVSVTDLGDRDYRPVIRALFGILQREKSAYLRAERPTVRTTIATRLTNIALTLRTLVEAVLHTFSPKTIRFVLSGIKDVLQLDEGWLLDAVAPDLTRILASITGYPSHVEHLPHDEWIDLISFTAELLSEAVLYESEGQLVHNNGGQLDSHSSVNGLISEPGLSHVSSSRQTKLSTLDRASTEEVITALEQLTAFARSPGLNLSKHIANVVVAFLRSSHVPGRSHPVAFRICRNLVSQHGLDSTQWTQQLLRDVIPLMIRFWGTRSESTSLREGILLLLLEGWNFLQEVYSSPRSKGDRTSIDTLIDVLSNDYSRRSDKEQLTVDDLLFACPGLSPPLTGVPLQKRLFSLRRLRLRTEVEQAWTILQFCASFAGDTKHRPSNQEPLNNEENDDGPRATKRIKTSHMSIKPLGRVKNQSSGEALLVLQVLLFRLEEQHLSLEELSATLDSLKLSMSGDDNLIGAWAFIAVSSCMYQPEARHESLISKWKEVWQLALTAIKSVSLCRAACLTVSTMLHLNTVDYRAVADSIHEMMESIDMSGPAALTETSLDLWDILIEHWSVEARPTMPRYKTTIMQWLSSRFTPVSWIGKVTTDSLFLNIRSRQMVDFLCILRGRSLCPPQPKVLLRCGPLAEGWYKIQAHPSAYDYLLGLHPRAPTLKMLTIRPSRPLEEDFSQDNPLLDLFAREGSLAVQNWTDCMLEKQIRVTPEQMIATCELLLVLSSCLEQWRSSQTTQISRLREVVRDLESVLCSFSKSDECTMGFVDEAVARMLLWVSHNKSSPSSAHPSSPSMMVPLHSVQLMDSLREKYILDSSATPSESLDPMDLDEDPDSQSSRSMLSASARVAGVVANHDHSSQLDAFRPAAFLLLQVHAGFAAQKSGTQPSVLSNLISIAPATLLTMKDTVSLLLLETAYLSVPDIEVFSQHLSEALLQGTEFDYCESAQYLLVGVLLSLVKRRDLNQTEVFSDVGRSLFLFVHGLIDRKMCYPSVLLAFAELLCELLKIRMDLVIDSSISSVRTILFKILQSSDVLIKFQLADHFSAVFQEFDHADHEEVFKDVLDHLPSDKSWLEGIAVRLYFLAHLGSRWPTLLRRSVYHLVETPASIPACASFAARCMSTIATALHFDTAKELFRIFSPQLTYTWLRSQDLAELPYSIFGYPTLLELLKDGQEEITAQLFVAPDGDRVAEIADLLGEDKLSVLLRAFPLTAAYCISQDVTAMKPRSKDSSNLYMGRLRQLMGSENLHTLLLQHIPTILCIFFLRTDKPASFEEACNKVEALRLYAVNSAAIQLSLPADKHLPISQQPCFKAKILVGQILRLSEWAKIPFGEFWTASNCTSIVRSLLSVLQLPLGSLHACALITRIKMFIVIGGPRSSSGYHIQQLLHSLQPWINDLDCAPHAISLLRFLLERAREFLCTVPAFTTGVGLSLLLSLQEASLERDNPHSEHDHGSRDTVQNVAEFRYWLSSYLVGLEIPGEATETLTEIIADAASLLEVTAHQDEQDTNRLLFDLLEDDTRRISVLSGPVRSHLFEMLVTSHYDPGLFEHKTLQDDGSLARYLVPLWKIYCSGKGKAVFRSWVGKLLGKSFASNGNLPAELSREFVISSTDRQISPKPSQGFSSFKAITQSLLDLLFDPSRVTTGLAEETLSKMLRDLPRDTELMRFMSAEEPYVVEALGAGYILPEQTVPKTIFLEDLMAESSTSSALSKVEWIQSFCLYLIQKSDPAASIKCLASAVANSDSLASSFFPYLLHLALLNDLRLQTPLRNDISTVFRSFLTSIDSRLSSQCKTLLEAIMFLRNQARPGETTAADREDWLDINHLSAAQAALRSGMPKTALLLVEIDDSRERGPGRRTSRGSLASSHELLRDIYEQLDDPDSFYGISDESSLKAVMKRAEHEKDGMKLLSLRGAEYDHIIFSKDASLEPSKGIVGALDRLNLAGLSHSFSQHSFSQGAFTDLAESFYSTARKLERWDIGRPRESESEAADVFTLCQDLSSAHSSASIRRALSSGLLRPFDRIKESISHSAQLQSIMRNLAIAAEADELFSSQSGADLAKVLSQMATRTQWMHVGRFDDVEPILSTRSTMLSVARTVHPSVTSSKSFEKQIQIAHVQSLLQFSDISIDQGHLQNSLGACVQIAALADSLKEEEIQIEGASISEEARVLWAQGDTIASIKALERLDRSIDYTTEDIGVVSAEVLARIAYQSSEARLEKPEFIMEQYFKPAVLACRGYDHNPAAGFVHHQFALFCDSQLQNADNNADLERMKYLVVQKQDEIKQFEQLLRDMKPIDRKAHLSELEKAHKWLNMDAKEYDRLEKSRETLLQQCLENYLLSLQTSERYNGDVLRFCSLWLAHAHDKLANRAVRHQLSNVPTRKFGEMMNQLTSRLLDEEDEFQVLLHGLVFQVSVDHPYHGLYQLFSMKHGQSTDELAKSRTRAAVKITKKLDGTPGQTHDRWYTTQIINCCYFRLAVEKEPKVGKYESGQRIPIIKSNEAYNLQSKFKRNPAPPPTMTIELREDCNYQDIPTVFRLRSEMSIASGVSKPKVITCIASDGVEYKQLVKGGSDDPRQDTIMEQVFENVSKLLQQNRDTRQRNLKIYTYRIIPLTTMSGAIIEWVQDTLPLNDYLTPSHRLHFPRDFRPDQCRRLLLEAQSKTTEQRVKAYRHVCEHFRPCLHYFFLEKFIGPDEWFDKRLTYSRSTAAISILGHVMGLGDRHLNNILLHQKTGALVHIDLGIAFEAGRVLPVPELVPFRLSRDIVDGLGITKIEGVFRRCCEFTLDALRKQSATIETILDVLRFDPLYSWTTSPVRLEKMQQAQLASLRPGFDPKRAAVARGEGGEAERAITVVKKKLSGTLSVQATVNELIQQAQDERNLAVLYAGWGAYM